MSLAQMAIAYCPIQSLQLDPNNPRLHSKRQIGQIARSIEAFGFNVPVLIDKNRKVIAGHGRILACRQLGWPEVPTICIEHLSQEKIRAFMIADNRLTENSTWDNQLLAQQLSELSAIDLNFSLEATGFEIGEIDLRIESLNDPVQTKLDAAEEVSEYQFGQPVSRPGDLWLLDCHRVFCGNAIEPPSYATLMGEAKADLVFADAPYNVKIRGNVSGLGAVKHREFAMASGEMTSPEFTDFLSKVFFLLRRHSCPGSIHFHAMDWRHCGEILRAGEEVYSELKNICVWVKHVGGMGSLYRSRHEFVFVFKSGIGQHRNNVQLGKHGRNRTNVWEYRGANDFGRGTDEGNLLHMHPTTKPVAMVQDALLDCSKRNDVVLDPFLGSGTTLIAAQRAGRRCFGMELDPLYVDVIIRRWQAFTGQSARRATSGEIFGDIQ